jgi:CheY-like chemotaxis protein
MKKILLASSSRVFLKRNNNLLMKRGFELFSVTTGEEAFKLNREYLFDLIIADIRLEDMGGDTFCSLVRREVKSRDIPIVIICHNIPGSIERIEQTSASAMLIKPIDPFELLKTISRFTGLQLGRSKRAVIKVIVISKKHDEEFVCFSRDISNTGILLETEYPLDLGSMLICKFALPGACRIEIEGEVIRCMNSSGDEPLYGIKFIHMQLSSARLIDNYIASIPDPECMAQNIVNDDSKVLMS